jgi:branched-chain amino acid transport system ATP-binding protein
MSSVPPEALLSLDQVTTYYGQMRILEGISLHVNEGELVCLLGGNASGKSTTLKTILGIVRPRSGRVLLSGRDVTQWPVPQRIATGIAIVPENRRLFGQLTVRENLELGAVLRRGESLAEDFDRVHELFPRLLERRSQLAGTLSGGEQQMVAMGRALMSRPRLLLMDEPSMGLSPALVLQNFQIIKTIHASGVAVLMVEQNATMALSIADRGYVLSTGEIVLEGRAADLLQDEDLKRAYLGRLSSHQALCRVPTVTCGQLMPLKFSRTVWVYCNCVGADCPCRVSSQKVHAAETAVAFGPSAPPFRKAVFAVPPPGVGRSMVVTCSVVVAVMCWPAIAVVRTLLGLLTMVCVMPVSPAPEVRKLVWLVSVCSGKSIVWVGGPPMPNGLMPLIAMFGPPFAVAAVPWNSTTVPCGMEASRPTVGTTFGSVVAGTATHRPGSMCSPAFRFASVICCR